jgi:FAD-dependent oxidoreductase domain-containing protein 1
MQAARQRILIVGAGLIGSSVAMALSLKLKDFKNTPKITVVDLDLMGSLSSSELNAGGVRATWGQELNILASIQSIEYFQKFSTEIGYRPCGYLWLHGEETFESALKASVLQRRLGWEVQKLTPDEIPNRFPLLDQTHDIKGAFFAPRDGLVNPNLLKNHFRQEARNNGVKFLDGIWIDHAHMNSNNKITISGKKYSGPSGHVLSHEDKIEIFQTGRSSKLKSTEISWGGAQEELTVVNCAGAWAPGLSKLLNSLCPSIPQRRQVSIFDTRDADLTPYGMIVDTSGVYFHPEATNGLAGFAPHNEPEGIHLAGPR